MKTDNDNEIDKDNLEYFYNIYKMYNDDIDSDLIKNILNFHKNWEKYEKKYEFEDAGKDWEEQPESEPVLALEIKNPFTNRWISCGSEEEMKQLEFIFDIEKQLYKLIKDAAKEGKKDSKEIRDIRKQLEESVNKLGNIEDVNNTPSKYRAVQKKREAQVVEKCKLYIDEFTKEQALAKEKALYDSIATNAWDNHVHLLDDLLL